MPELSSLDDEEIAAIENDSKEKSFKAGETI